MKKNSSWRKFQDPGKSTTNLENKNKNERNEGVFFHSYKTKVFGKNENISNPFIVKWKSVSKRKILINHLLNCDKNNSTLKNLMKIWSKLKRFDL